MYLAFEVELVLKWLLRTEKAETGVETVGAGIEKWAC